jgi:hypothetical protein
MRICGQVKVFKREGPGFWPQALKPLGNSLSYMQAATIARTFLEYKQCLSGVQVITISNSFLHVNSSRVVGGTAWNK